MEKAIESGGGTDPDILEHYGDILEAMGQKDEAVKYWKKAQEAGGNPEELMKKIDE